MRAIVAALLAASVLTGAAAAERPGLGERRLPHFDVALILDGAVQGRFADVELGERTVVLRRGFAGELLRKWGRASLIEKQPIRLDGTIVLLARDGTPTKSWTFTQGYPVKWEGPDFDAGKNELAIETIEIAHEGLEFG